MKNAADPLEAMSAVIRAWWVAHFRDWKMRITGRACSYGTGRMPRWDGGVDGEGRRFRPYWPKVAAHCVAHGYEPERLIRAYFASKSHDSTVVPSKLLTAEAARAYDADAGGADRVDRLRRALQQMALTVKGEAHACERAGIADVDAEVAYCLKGNAYGFTDIFRYCVFDKQGDGANRDAYAASATAQYLLDRAAYDAAWGGFIPDGLRRLADGLEAGLRLRGGRP